MRYNLRLDHMELSDFDREQLDKKMDVLHKHLRPPYITDVTFLHSTHHLNGDEAVTCIINIENGKTVYHADRSGPDAQRALDRTLEAMERELRRAHEKQKAHRV